MPQSGESHPERPADSWQPELDELRRRMELARAMGGPEKIARQHEAGRMTVRERIDWLLDSGSFHESGALAGRAEYDEEGNLREIMPSNCVVGRGRIGGRPVVVYGDDFTIRGGAADGSVAGKMVYGEKLAIELRMPLIRLVDGTGGGGSVKTSDKIGRTYVPANPGWDLHVTAMGDVPVVAAALGPVAGIGAARVCASHFSIMVKGTSQVFVAGPPVVERAYGAKVEKEALGGSWMHAHGNGVVDNEATSDEDALEQVKRFLSYLPDSVYEAPPRGECDDSPDRREEALISAVPRDRRRPYEVRRILEMTLDRGSFFEMGRFQGRPLATGFARLNGWPVGVMANDTQHKGGGLDNGASEKLTRFVDLCDTFHLPIVNFVDNPGFVIGEESEREGVIRRGVRALTAIQQSRVPFVSILLRRVYGVAGAGHGRTGLNLRYAWPSGEWGSLPIEGGVQAAFRREIEAHPEPAKRRAELEEHYSKMRSPFLTAEAFGVEEIIDPRDTRPLLVDWVERAYKIVPTMLGPTARGMRP